MGKKHVVQIYLEPDEYEFLKRHANADRRSLAQTLLAWSEFYDRMIAEQAGLEPAPQAKRIRGINFTDTPIDDYN